MASFFNVGALGINPFSTAVGQKIGNFFSQLICELWKTNSHQIQLKQPNSSRFNTFPGFLCLFRGYYAFLNGAEQNNAISQQQHLLRSDESESTLVTHLFYIVLQIYSYLLCILVSWNY